MKNGITNPSEGYLGKKCRNMILKYTQAGIIKRPQVCDKCGETNSHIIAHHYDYILPFDIFWMCPKCHRRVHSNLRILTPRDRQTMISNRIISLRAIILEALTGENIEGIESSISPDILPLKINVSGMVITACKYCGYVWNIEDNDNALICPKCNNDISERETKKS